MVHLEPARLAPFGTQTDAQLSAPAKPYVYEHPVARMGRLLNAEMAEIQFRETGSYLPPREASPELRRVVEKR